MVPKSYSNGRLIPPEPGVEDFDAAWPLPPRIGVLLKTLKSKIELDLDNHILKNPISQPMTFFKRKVQGQTFASSAVPGDKYQAQPTLAFSQKYLRMHRLNNSIPNLVESFLFHIPENEHRQLFDYSPGTQLLEPFERIGQAQLGLRQISAWWKRSVLCHLESRPLKKRAFISYRRLFLRS